MSATRQADGKDYYPSTEKIQHVVTARVGEWLHDGGRQKQPVVFLSVDHDRTVVLNYDTLLQLIDSLCRQKERLAEKIFSKMEIPKKTIGCMSGKH